MRIFGKGVLALMLVFMTGICLPAQNNEQRDSLVILVSSQSAQMVDIAGASYRKVVGPARFLHNGTYLLCDTALWNVDTRIIEAWGNVSILQEETVLTSERLTYIVDDDLAQFRGSVVQLEDKDHNTLRTRHLDYNTKDSVAVFRNGGAMRDKDGQIIESRTGTYDSKIKTFTFTEDVNMFTDSIFVKSNNLVYESDLDLATFGRSTDAWHEENMLSSNGGWYDRRKEIFFFKESVHVMSQDQEGWCDSLYFHRMTSDVDMLGNAQVSDTTRNVYGLADRIEYIDSLSKVRMTRNPAMITRTEDQNGVVDTVYLGAESLVYYTVKRCDIDSLTVAAAEERIASLEVDPIGEFRHKAAEAAAKAAEEEARKDPNYRPKNKPKAETSAPKKSDDKMPMSGEVSEVAQLSDSLSVSDTLSVSDSLVVSDTLALADSLVLEPKDTTEIGFMEAMGNVKIYRKDMQVVCDSLLYSDLDSLARLFKSPVIWQEEVRQYSSDSVAVLVRGGRMQKASLMSNAFIIIQEDSTHYDQIRGTEMLAYFDEKGGLERFDVLGGASALFYIEENEALSTVNKAESKMLYATFKDGNIQRIYYFEEPKNDGYPVVQLSDEDRQLKGFDWQPDRRPADRTAVTGLSLRPCQRRGYSARPRAKFMNTDIYFPGYMSDIYMQIHVRDSLRKVREREEALAEIERKNKERLDSIVRRDSLARIDSLAFADSIAFSDSLRIKAERDSLALADSLRSVADSIAVADSLASIGKILTPDEIKAAKKAEKAKQRAAAKEARLEKKRKRLEEKEKRWAELDRRDEEKLKAKEQRKLEKIREKKRKALEEAMEQAKKDAAVLERYRQKFLKKKEEAQSREKGK